MFLTCICIIKGTLVVSDFAPAQCGQRKFSGQPVKFDKKIDPHTNFILM